MLKRELSSPERDEINLRAEHFELEQRRRNRVLAGIVLVIVFAASWLVGSLLGVLL